MRSTQNRVRALSGMLRCAVLPGLCYAEVWDQLGASPLSGRVCCGQEASKFVAGSAVTVHEYQMSHVI